MNWLRQLLARIFPPVSRSDALRIASQALADKTIAVPLVCHGAKPSRYHIYRTTTEPCWYIEVPWNDDKGAAMLRSSRVILVGKLTGAIHYDGSAGDEG